MLENISILQLALFTWEAEAMLCAPSKFKFNAFVYIMYRDIADWGLSWLRFVCLWLLGDRLRAL